MRRGVLVCPWPTSSSREVQPAIASAVQRASILSYLWGIEALADLSPLFVHGAGQRARRTSFASASHSQVLRIFGAVAGQGRPLIAKRLHLGPSPPAFACGAAPGRTGG
jgi:hypothetical protein